MWSLANVLRSLRLVDESEGAGSKALADFTFDAATVAAATGQKTSSIQLKAVVTLQQPPNCCTRAARRASSEQFCSNFLVFAPQLSGRARSARSCSAAASSCSPSCPAFAARG